MLGRGKLTLVAALVAACGGDTAASPAREERCDGVQEACATLASVTCARVASCESPAGAGQRFSTDAECRERWALACTGWVQVADSKIAVADVAACSSEIETAECGRVESIALARSFQLPWCLRIPGARSDASCSSDAQCATSFCATSEREGGGTCKATLAEPAYENEPCSAMIPCASTLTCESGRCVRETCGDTCYDHYASCGGIDNPTQRCPSGTECVNRSDRGTGQCAPYALDGEACGGYDGPRCLFPARCVGALCTLPERMACSE